jgi:hypothetical protein
VSGYIENQSKALADYALLKFRGNHNDAHDHLRLYTEDVLKEIKQQTIKECVEAVKKIRDKNCPHDSWLNEQQKAIEYTCNYIIKTLQEKGDELL